MIIAGVEEHADVVIDTSLMPLFAVILIILIVLLCVLCVELAAYRRYAYVRVDVFRYFLYNYLSVKMTPLNV